LQPLAWDDGDRWKLWLDVRQDDRDQWKITGSLRRGGTHVELSEPSLIVEERLSGGAPRLRASTMAAHSPGSRASAPQTNSLSGPRTRYRNVQAARPQRGCRRSMSMRR
jgi:hypothetical protein